MQHPHPLRSLSLALATSFLLAACGADPGKSGKPPAQSAPPVPTVTALTVKSESVPLVAELPGRTAPYLIAEVRPQVGGLIEARNFSEGSDVKAGELLYRIDPAPYRANVESAQAALARAEANLAAAKLKADRHAELVGIEAVSKQAHDDAQAAYKQAQAEVSAARAALNKARIDLERTEVRAPIAGRIGRSTVTQGALVTANQDKALATIQRLDPIYVDLTQSSAELLRIRRELDAGRLQRNRNGDLSVQLTLEDGSPYAQTGTLALSEVSVDPGTGSVTLRAKFPNPKGELLPGMYVRAKLAQGVRGDAILVPHKALVRDPRGNAMVMRIDADNKVEARPVQAVQSIGDKWVVTSGLADGDRIILEGLQKARPGSPVQVQEAGAAPAGAPSAAGGR